MTTYFPQFRILLKIILIINTLILSSLFSEIKLIHAKTKEEIDFGLMSQSDLDFDSGMLFHIQPPHIVRFWALACLFDLDIAFANEKGIVFLTSNLKAYPEKMDPKRAITRPKDLALYPHDDPVTEFFAKRAVSSQRPASFVLEMKKGGFQKHGIKTGYVLKSTE